MPKKKTSHTISDEARRLIEKLSQRMGISQSSVLEIAVRELAERKGIK